MEDWFEIKKDDVIEILKRKKEGLPWGNHEDEIYTCLIFWEDEIIRMTVDEFYELDDDTYYCCRYYTTYLADNMNDYKKLTKQKISEKAYNAWCTGAR